ncbi:MAG: hypothetical protein ACRD0Y_07085 [Terriglobales bacterium]
MPQKGEIAPPLTVTDQDGEPRSLASLSGPKGLVLLFYRGYW